MPSKLKAPATEGAPGFDPDAFFDGWNLANLLAPNSPRDLRGAINRAFKLKPNDGYVYHAIASVTLEQVQQAIDAGRQHGLCAWYQDEEGKETEPPPSADIVAYTSIFSASTASTKALTSFAANAKKGSLRAGIAANLQSHMHPPPAAAKLALPNKQKTQPANPYLDVWTWSCQALGWAGPAADTVRVRQSHAVLPIFYHHFGCVVPSFDAVSLLAQLAKQPPAAAAAAVREIIEVGSGNGYWAFVLRRAGLRVTAVDNALSAWRTMWVGDTVTADGVSYLQKRGGAPEAILLLVYPQVSAEFTSRVIRAYAGDVVVVAGTQNGNGYTGFKDEVIDTWMARERKEFEKVLQIPLPSFAAKDEALFVFRKRGRES